MIFLPIWARPPTFRLLAPYLHLMTIYGGVVLYFRYWDKQVQEAVPGPGCGFEPSKLPQMGYHTGGELACFRRPKYCCTEYCLGFTWVSELLHSRTFVVLFLDRIITSARLVAREVRGDRRGAVRLVQ